MDESHNLKSPTEDDPLAHRLPLRTAPSFEIYNTREGFGYGETNLEEVLKRTITIGQSIEAMGSGEFSFGKKEMDLIEEEGESEKDGLIGIQKLEADEEVEPPSPPMYLAAGLGVDRTGFEFDNCTSDGLSMPNLDGSDDVEEHYKRMVEEYPCHPLILRNYAQILQSNGDLHRAEEYFLRATLVDQNNGEILVQYAKLVWDLHHDKQRALEYFQRAAQTASPDSQVLAAYASFLWETEDDDEEEGGRQDTNSKVQNENNEQMIKHFSTPKQDNQTASPFLHPAAGEEIGAAELTATNYGRVADIEDYYRKMIDENPTNPLFLKSYAQFLIQSKEDLHGPEECFARATLADPDDGEILVQYAQLLWELHQDKDKALTYFERTAQAAPLDSDVQAAYARFLWEIEDNEVEDGEHQTNEESDKYEQHIKIVKDGKVEIDTADLTPANFGKDGSVEDYYKKMIDENPTNSFFLKNYAQFLIQSKKDLQAAEKYYSRAILADPGDGEMISEYAKLEWELHHDWKKALFYFEQAVQATPEDSNVLAAYACFLWETEDVEAEI